MTETESAQGEFFGDRQLERVVRHCARRTPSQLSDDELLAEADRWRPPAVAQQDDITLIVIDVE